MNTAQDFAKPSFLDVWWGNPQLEYRSDDESLLRTENRQVVEQKYLMGLARATWTTISIATLGSLLSALLALPLAVVSARNLAAPQALRWGAQGLLGVLRSIHTLVFGMVLWALWALWVWGRLPAFWQLPCIPRAPTANYLPNPSRHSTWPPLRRYAA